MCARGYSSNAKGKPYIEGKVGDDLQRDTGEWMHLQRIIDRVKDWYTEVVTDAETGKIVHRCEEPLSQHRGHCSAKHKLRCPVIGDRNRMTSNAKIALLSEGYGLSPLLKGTQRRPIIRFAQSPTLRIRQSNSLDSSNVVTTSPLRTVAILPRSDFH
jgi:hypothetical protein